MLKHKLPKGWRTLKAAKFHAAASIFPLMQEKDLKDLAEDIKTFRLRDPIRILNWEGFKPGSPDGEIHDLDLVISHIVDGRNRFLACQMAGVKPHFQVWDTDPGDSSSTSLVAYILSQNLKRRHLTDAQRAASVLKAKPFFAAEAKERQRAAGGKHDSKKKASVPADKKDREPTVRQRLADEADVTEHLIRQLEKIQEASPELLDKVQAGELSLPDAVKLLPATPAEKDPVDAATAIVGRIRRAIGAAPEIQLAIWAELNVLWNESHEASSSRPAKVYDPEKAARSCIKRLRSVIELDVNDKDRAAFVKRIRPLVEQMLDSFTEKLPVPLTRRPAGRMHLPLPPPKHKHK